MSRYEKLISTIIRGSSDANINFEDLRLLLLKLGFEERVRGNHHIFRKTEIEEKIHLQRDGSHAKPYQVRQVRRILIENGIIGRTSI